VQALQTLERRDSVKGEGSASFYLLYRLPRLAAERLDDQELEGVIHETVLHIEKQTLHVYVCTCVYAHYAYFNSPANESRSATTTRGADEGCYSRAPVLLETTTDLSPRSNEYNRAILSRSDSSSLARGIHLSLVSTRARIVFGSSSGSRVRPLSSASQRRTIPMQDNRTTIGGNRKMRKRKRERGRRKERERERERKRERERERERQTARLA